MYGKKIMFDNIFGNSDGPYYRLNNWHQFKINGFYRIVTVN